MKHNKRTKNKGFSLVELIIVIAIMAILAGAITPTLIRYIDKARQARFIKDAKNVLLDAQADYTTQLSSETNNYESYKPIALGQINSIECDMVYVYPDDSLDLSTLKPTKNHAYFYVNPTTGLLIGCVYNDGKYTGFWQEPDSAGTWTLTKN